MEVVKSILAWIFVTVFVGGLLFLLYSIVRFSIISPILTRGAKERLRKPNLDGIEEVVGFCPSSALVNFYRSWPFIEKSEYYLVDTERSAKWFIGGFIPLSKVDSKEWIKVSGRHGLPIADDLNKGTYFVLGNGTIELRSPNVSGGRARVACSIEEMMKFRIAEWEEIDRDDGP